MAITYDSRETSNSSEWQGTVLALLIPPLEVWRRTRWSQEFWLNLALTLTAYFPGIMHALFISQRESMLHA